jgi:hypothetical protein
MKPVAKSPFLLGVVSALLLGGSAMAEPVSVEAVLTPEESMKFELGDGSKHFVLAVRRQGTFEGSGAFDGANVIEFGWHDVNPPVRGDPQGYLQLTAQNGDIAVLHWTADAVFVKGADGPTLFNNGTWKLVSGTGQFADKTGVGSLSREPAGGPTKFTVEGDIGDKVPSADAS